MYTFSVLLNSTGGLIQNGTRLKIRQADLHFCTRFELMTMCVSFLSWAIARVFCDGGWEPRPGPPCRIWLCLPTSDGVQMGFLWLFFSSQAGWVWTTDFSSQAEFGGWSLDGQGRTQMVLNWEARDGWCSTMAKLEINSSVKSSWEWKYIIHHRKWQKDLDFIPLHW